MSSCIISNLKQTIKSFYTCGRYEQSESSSSKTTPPHQPTHRRSRSRRRRRQRHRRKIIPITRAPTPIAHPLVLQLQNLRRQGRDNRVILLHDCLAPPLKPTLSLPIVRVRRDGHQIPEIKAVARVSAAPARAVERLRRYGDDNVRVCLGPAGRGGLRRRRRRRGRAWGR